MLPLLAFTPLFLAAFYGVKTVQKQTLVLVLFTLVIYCFFPWRYGLIFLVFMLVNTTLIASKLIKYKQVVVLGIIFNLSLLVVFKYIQQTTYFSHFTSQIELWLFPVGISFYVLQGISALIDSHTSTEPPSTKKTILFLCFFPHLLMGPILKLNIFINSVRYKELDKDKMRTGFSCIVLGLFFKKVLADNLALQTQWLNYPHLLLVHSLNLVVELLAEHFRLYLDFYGYSLIAYGLARLFGYQIMINFKSPLQAKCMTDFWRRWNISLSTFIRDYVYIPLGGKYASFGKRYLSLLLCFILVGLWHGASLNFVFWGAFHGSILAIEKILAPLLKPGFKLIPRHFRQILSFVYTSLILAFAMILFHFNSLEMIKLFFQSVAQNYHFTLDKQQLLLVFAFTLPALFYDFFPSRLKFKCLRSSMILALLLVLLLTSFAPERPFMYMRF